MSWTMVDCNVAGNLVLVLAGMLMIDVVYLGGKSVMVVTWKSVWVILFSVEFEVTFLLLINLSIGHD